MYRSKIEGKSKSKHISLNGAKFVNGLSNKSSSILKSTKKNTTHTDNSIWSIVPSNGEAGVDINMIDLEIESEVWIKVIMRLCA